MSPRRFGSTVVIAVIATLTSTMVPGSVQTTYSDIMGCESGCKVAAAGFPFPYIVDYPGISPVNSADLTGALLGMDHVHWGRAAATFATWLAASLLVVHITSKAIRRSAS